MSTLLTDPELPEKPNRFGPVRPVLAATLLIAFYLIVSTWVFGGLDLRDLPGPGGVKIVTALGTGNFDRTPASSTIAWSLPFFGQDILAATRFWMRLGGICTVLGGFLCGLALVGPRVAICTGLIAVCWSQPLYIGQLVGADSIALGTCWMGVGLTWFGALIARRTDRWWWSALPIAAMGVGLAAFSITIKVVALPAAILVGVAPFLVSEKLWEKSRDWKALGLRFLSMSLAIGITYFAFGSNFAPTQSGHVQETPPLAWATLRDGWSRLQGLPTTQPETGVLLSLIQLSWAGALIPGRAWLWRFGLGLAGTAALAYSVQTIGDKIHVRTLTTAALPIVLLCGCFLGLGVHWIGRASNALRTRVKAPGHPLLRPNSPILRTARCIPWILPLTVSSFLFMDALSFIHAWGGLRAQYAGAEAVDLPRAPLAWERRYSRMGGVTFEDTSAYGSISLTELAIDPPSAGIAGVPLRDARDFHLRAAAVLNESPFVILEQQRCRQHGPCTSSQSDEQCAQSVIRQLDRIGARLILPRTDTGPGNRYGQREWTQRLENVLLTYDDVVSVANLWWTWEGSGQEGPLPCCGGGESCYAPGQPPAPPMQNPGPEPR